MATTEWRDDDKNLPLVRELNRAYAHLPFSREYKGVLDTCPFELRWTVGPNLPVAWKGGVAGLLGDMIVMVGGLWMPCRRNLAYAYHISQQTYTTIPPPPFETAYTQGACDGQHLYIVGGRAAGPQVARLSRTADGTWECSLLPSLPESETRGRWLATAAVSAGLWLYFLTGHPTGTPSENRTRPALADWRLRLDHPNMAWEPMAPYPGGARSLVSSAVVGENLYVFGGSLADPAMRTIYNSLRAEVGLVSEPHFAIPYNGVPNYRDAYRYDPTTDTWRPLRSLPFPMIAGSALPVTEGYILLMGSADVTTQRVGKAVGPADATWRGYGDVILCYDIEQDNYSRVGVMPYGVATCPWVYDGDRVFGLGGEPAHGMNENTENVAQIGTLVARETNSWQGHSNR